MKKIYQITLAVLFSLAFSMTVSAQCHGPFCVVDDDGGNGGGNGSGCPTVGQMSSAHEAGGGLCSGSVTHINNPSSNIDYVDWDWAISVHTGSVLNGGTSAAILYPGANWTGYNLNVCASAVTNSGFQCNTVCLIETLDCDRGNR